jgi:hypothetical protein
VRGTKFGVKVEPVNKTSAQAQPLYLAAASETLPTGLLAQAADEPQLQTTVYGFAGQVSVTSTVDGTTQTVGAGQNVVMGPAGGGPVVVTPPSEANQFSNETEAAPDLGEDGEEGEGSDDAGGTDSSGTSEEADDEGAEESEEGDDQDAAADTGAGDSDAALTDAEAAATDLNQVVATATITAVSGRVGYFSALLSRFYGGTYTLADIYVNKDPQLMESGSVTANSIVDSQGFIRAAGTDTPEGNVYMDYMKSIPGPIDSGPLGTSRPMDNPDNSPGYPNDDELGSNNYMSWGFWRMSKWVAAPSGEYAVIMKAYRLEGEITPTEVAAGIVGHYSGPAYGTYFETANTWGTDMTGVFQCDVNVPANSITNFGIDVSGGGKTAYIYNGTGSFLPGSTNSFTINGGTWMLGPVGAELPATRKAANGALFGPTGGHIGGSWGMDAGSGNNAAVGIFVGDRHP